MKTFKKALIMACALVILGGSALMAAPSQWEWDDPYVVSTKVTRIAAGDQLYGIDQAGAVSTLTLGATEAGTSAAAGAVSAVLDIGVGRDETVFAVMAGLIATWSTPAVYTALPQQPKVPAAGGSYKQIAVGDNGYVYVLFETPAGAQYILKGRGMNENLTVRFDPRTLDLRSRGNWVLCKLNLPAGYSEKDIDPDSVEITRLQAPVAGGTAVDAAVSIFRAPGSPSAAGHDHLYVRFLRYDKSNPANTQALNTVLSGLLPAPDTKKITYTVTATVVAQISSTGEWFEGMGTFNVTVHHAR